MLGLIMVFLRYPIHPRFARNRAFQLLDVLLIGSVILCFGYVFVQTEPVFQAFWFDGKSLGDRAGAEVSLDYIIGGLGLLLILEATRRFYWCNTPTALSRISALCRLWTVYAGLAVPASRLFRSTYRESDIFTQSRAFGIALRVMFTYVFLFVLSGRCGADRRDELCLGFGEACVRFERGAPAKVAVLSSGMMGSLSGSLWQTRQRLERSRFP